MEEENKYDQESIRELLSWAQNTLNNKTYPEGELVLDKCIKVIDCKSHIEAMIQMICSHAVFNSGYTDEILSREDFLMLSPTLLTKPVDKPTPFSNLP